MLSYKSFERDYKLAKVFNYNIFDNDVYCKHKGLIEHLFNISDKCEVTSTDEYNSRKQITYNYYYNKRFMFNIHRIDNRLIIGKTSSIMLELSESNGNYHFIVDFIANFIDHDNKIKEYARKL